MPNQSASLASVALFLLTVGLTLSTSAPARAQDTAQQQLQHLHTPQSIDQELARLTKDLELTPAQQQQVRPILVEHHDKLQALFDKNPAATRQQLFPQIHAISDQTHHEIHALLTDHQQQLEKEMVQRENNGQENQENRHPVPPGAATPAPPPAS